MLIWLRLLQFWKVHWPMEATPFPMRTLPSDEQPWKLPSAIAGTLSGIVALANPVHP
jgi:hypothetical protein